MNKSFTFDKCWPNIHWSLNFGENSRRIHTQIISKQEWFYSKTMRKINFSARLPISSSLYAIHHCSTGKRTFSVSMGFILLFFSSRTLFLFVLHKLILLQYRTQKILDKLNVAEANKSVRIISDEYGGLIIRWNKSWCHKHHLKQNNLETYFIR